MIYCAAVICGSVYGSTAAKVYQVDNVQQSRPRAMRVFLRPTTDLGNKDRCLRQAYNDFAKRIVWSMKVLGIKCIESAPVHQDWENPENLLAVLVDIKSVHHKVILTLQITDRYGIVKDQTFTVDPGEWYCEIPRLIADTIASLVLSESQVFSTPIFAVIKREEDGRQEIVRGYLDGIDSESVGVSYREIFSVNPVADGVVYTGLARSNFVIKRLSGNQIVDLEIADGCQMYDLDIRDSLVAFTRITEDGVAEFGTISNVQGFLYPEQRSGCEVNPDAVILERRCDCDRYLGVQVLRSARLGRMLSPSISPSQKHIAFLSDEDILRTMSVYVYDLEHSKLRRITTQRAVQAVQWCPSNNNLLAILAEDADGKCRVCLIDQDGVVLNLSQPIEHPLSIKWSSDGSGLLVCVASKQNSHTMYMIPLQTMEMHPVGGQDTEYLFAAM